MPRGEGCGDPPHVLVFSSLVDGGRVHGGEERERERARSLGIAHILFDQFDLTVLKLRGRGRERGRERERASEREGEGEREREREGGAHIHNQP